MIMEAYIERMYMSPEEIALAMQMNGSTAEDLLVQEHARTTTNSLEQVSFCREVLNILDWKFPSYSKNSSASYKLLCSILQNATKFKGMYLSPEEIALAMQMNGTSAEYLLVQEHLAEPRTTTHLLEQETPISEGEWDLVKTRMIAKQKSIKSLQYTKGKKSPSTVKSVKTLKKKRKKNKRGTRSIKPVKNSVDTVIEEVEWVMLNNQQARLDNLMRILIDTKNTTDNPSGLVPTSTGEMTQDGADERRAKEAQMSELGVAEAVPADLDIEPVWDESSHGVPLLIPTCVVPSTHVVMEEEEQQQPLSQWQQQQQQQLLSPSPPQQPPQQQQQAVPLPQQQQKQQVMQLGFDGPITSLAKVHILILLGHLANVVMDFTTENLSTSGLKSNSKFRISDI
ncbi:hypothetical protein DAPPUDRAFT_250801 [Daphnia pulex]|uniref:Uncharacterized protein n=1 Tax=Daphnia pulex TaxID=6669 RepID=E9GZB1_DAPPU|nr:hypothetical protein DAPPUDRAFT_250801 [Daphnia pulex]|eukprot:EFX75118.1 hypothetical protein DAPPUDRAFT_250801 [Daphnia pulex]